MRLIFGLAFVVAVFFQNCGQMKGVSNFSSRQSLVSSKIFVPMATVDEGAMGTILADGGKEQDGTVTDLSDCLANGECESTGTLYVLNAPMTIDLPIKYYCSNNWTSLAGTNTLEATSLKVAFVAADNSVACEVASASFVTNVKNEKHLKAEIPVGACPNLKNGRYTLLVVEGGQSVNTNASTSITRRSIIIANDNHDKPKALQVDVEIDGQGYLKLKPTLGTTPYILYKKNQGGKANAACEEVNSPLVVQLSPRARKIRLSSPESGVQFNILGANDTPAHTLRPISWFTAGDAVSHYFITLPDASGNVNGIDQLFGNNTQGPDGQFAANGYLALAKWDGRRSDGSVDPDARDGVIDKKDEVFANLRFWSDRNVNGVAETMELFRVEEVGIVSINLDYDPNYSETDRWGNQIKMKSTVESVDGTLYLMYDIWYRRID